MVQRDVFRGFNGTNREIPQNLGSDAIGEPRGFATLLETARANHWGIGTVSLVARFNHPKEGIPSFFMCWEYTEDGKWQFESAKARNGQPLNHRDCLAVIKQPEYLLPEEPDNGR